MIVLLRHSWLFSSRSVAGVLQQQSVLSQMLQSLKKKYRGLKMKFKTLKILRARRIARRRRTTTEKGLQALIIGLALVLFLLVGCENGARHSIEITESPDYTTGDDGGKLKYKIICGITKNKD